MSRLAFTESAYYDAIILNYLNKNANITFPTKRIVYSSLVENQRYGEIKHKESELYTQNTNKTKQNKPYQIAKFEKKLKIYHILFKTKH